MNIKSSQIREFIKLLGDENIVQPERIGLFRNIFSDAYNWQSIPTDSENFKMVLTAEYGADAIRVHVKSPLEPETIIEIYIHFRDIKNGATWINITPKAAYKIQLVEGAPSMKMKLYYCPE